MLEKVLVGYRLERYLALIRACLINGAEDDPLAFYLWIQKRLVFGIFEKLGMVESDILKILHYNRHAFETEIIQCCAVGSLTISSAAVLPWTA